MEVLIIGGTRNMGHLLVYDLLAQGHQVTTFNRGLRPDYLPNSVKRLYGDRTQAQEMRAALASRDFDVVVDMVLFNAQEAETAIELFSGRVNHYVFVSSGQVYLVREGLERPFSEDDYAGQLMPAPKSNTYGYEEWLYGVGKRGAEDELVDAWQKHEFPYTSLRLPMVNSERDPINRLYSYILRIKDSGTILIPHTPQYPLRHVYAKDVVTAIRTVIETGKGKGRAYNLSQDETISLASLIAQIAEIMGKEPPELLEVKRSLLEANGFLPDCSPFSDRWMSELTNERSKLELGMHYTPLHVYLAKIVHYYLENPPQRPASYRRRSAERNLIA